MIPQVIISQLTFIIFIEINKSNVLEKHGSLSLRLFMRTSLFFEFFFIDFTFEESFESQ